MALVPPSLNYHTMYKTYVHKTSIKIDHSIIKNRTIPTHFLFTHHKQLFFPWCSCPRHEVMQPLRIEYISPHHCCCPWSKTCTFVYESPNQSHIELQVWHCFHRLVEMGHMHLVHNVWIHNGGISGMEYDPMPPFEILPLQSVITIKSMCVPL